MKLKTALEMLDMAPSDEKPSRINPNLTREMAVRIVRNAVATLEIPKHKTLGPDDEISELSELRVWQVFKDQKRPRY